MQNIFCNFELKGQTIQYKIPSSPIVADIRNVLIANFTFDEMWDGFTKTAVFTGPNTEPYNQLLVDDQCLVPPEVISDPGFYVSVFGGDLMTATKVLVPLKPSGMVEGLVPPVPTPDIYAQMIAQFDEAKEITTQAAGVSVVNAEKTGLDREAVKNFADQVSLDRSIVATDKALAQEANTGAQEARVGAEEAEEGANAAYINTMNAIGMSVCPLLDGKVPVGNIPLSVVHNVVEITSEEQLILLTPAQVQLNDVAAIVEGEGEDKIVAISYQLLGDGNPSIRTNWVEVGTSHASTAAYAAQAGASVDSAGLNGHPTIITSQSDYDSLTEKPAGVLYLVFPDAAFGG